jgi:hypothetical protein
VVMWVMMGTLAVMERLAGQALTMGWASLVPGPISAS